MARTQHSALAEIGRKNTLQGIAEIKQKFDQEKNVNRAVYRYIRRFGQNCPSIKSISRDLSIDINEVKKAINWLISNNHVESYKNTFDVLGTMGHVGNTKLGEFDQITYTTYKIK